MNNLYFSPDSLRSPLRENQRNTNSDTPNTNVNVLLESFKDVVVAIQFTFFKKWGSWCCLVRVSLVFYASFLSIVY